MLSSTIRNARGTQSCLVRNRPNMIYRQSINNRQSSSLAFLGRGTSPRTKTSLPPQSTRHISQCAKSTPNVTAPVMRVANLQRRVNQPSIAHSFQAFHHQRRHLNKLTAASISPKVLKTEYAVRGEVNIAAEKLELALKSNNYKLPFDRIIQCNIGNPQALKQKPLTYYRQILSLIEYPEMLEKPEISSHFPKDIVEKVRSLLGEIPSGLGAYSHSQGIPAIRRLIAKFIEKRDGYTCSPENIFMYNGASPGVQNVMRLLIGDNRDGVLISRPQYPLYSAVISLLDGQALYYDLDEENGWSLSIRELENLRKQAVDREIIPRALSIINPGNPTGQVLSRSNIEEIIKWAHKHSLVVMADEVYQENVYVKEKNDFVSFKQVLKSMGDEYDVPLFSFHSISKGMSGECGHRSGYVELCNVAEEVKAQLYKLSSINLCPNTAGQILMGAQVSPPEPGDDSYENFVKEKNEIYESLKRRAAKVVDFLNSLEGVVCNQAEGAMYAYPQIMLPRKAVDYAEIINKMPDSFYCLDLLYKTGVCVVPGSGFGQKEGTWHFRTTFLPPEDQLDDVFHKIRDFHEEFMNRFR